MAVKQAEVRVTRWSGGKHPSLSNLTRQLQKEGLRPYKWDATPNQRHAVRSHGYAKVLYVVDGVVEISLPDSNQRTRLKTGDRIDIPAGVRHGSMVGSRGASLLEAAVRNRR